MLSLLVAVVWALAVGGVAQAAPVSVGGFIGGNSGSTSTPPGAAGLFNQPRDAAVYEGTDNNPATDKLFVVEAQGTAQRVQRLDVNGNFERAWGKDVIQAGRPGNTGTGGEICVAVTDCQYGSFGNGAGEFDDPQGIAVNQLTGHVYVFDRDNRRVQEFDVDGSFIRSFGKDVGGPGVDVCTAGCGVATAGAAAGQFGASASIGASIAVSPVAPHDVFVADLANRRVLEFESDGDFARAYGYGVDTGTAQFEVCTTASTCQAANAAGNANGQFSTPASGTGSTNGGRLVVDSNGIVYASDASSAAAVGGQHRILRFDSNPVPPAGDATSVLYAPIACCDNAGTAPLVAAGTPGTSNSSGTVGMEISTDTDGAGPDEERLVVSRRNSSTGAVVVQELDIPTIPSDPIVNTFQDSPIGTWANLNGLGVNNRLDIYYVALGNTPVGGASGQHGLLVLAESAGNLAATIGATPDATAHTATLAGNVNPGGTASYIFEISKTGDAADWSTVGTKRYVSGTDDIPVTATATGLDANTLYRVRVRVDKPTGSTTTISTISAEGTFVTDTLPPDATTLAPSPRATASASLQGRINPNGSPTTYHFEYGRTTGYGQRAPLLDANAGAGAVPQDISQPVNGLQPNTTYHYRLVAQNPYGTVTGSDVTFTTRATIAPPPGRAYELVSPADKISGIGVGQYASGDLAAAVPGFASRDGNRFIAEGTYGATLTDGKFGFANDFAFATRTPAGWISQSAWTRRSYANAERRFGVPFAMSSDLSKVMFTSNGGHLTFFPEQADWDQPLIAPVIRDWDGNWEVLAPTDPAQEPSITIREVGAMAADGSHAALSADIYGVAGTGDPTADQVAGHATYIDDLSAGLSNTFPGAGQRSPVGVCTDGTTLPDRLPTGKSDSRTCPAPLPGRDAALISDRGASLGYDSTDSEVGNDSVVNVISGDGSRVFFMSPDPRAAGVPSACTGTGATTSCPPQLYVRALDSEGGVAVRWISKSTVLDQDASLIGPSVFEGASADGDKVFFRTNSPLAPDDPNGGSQIPGGVTTGTASDSSWDLYMYDFTDEPQDDPGAGTLTRISAGPTGAADSNNPQVGGAGARAGTLRALSVDGTRLYFVSAAPLPGVTGSGNGTVTSPGGSPLSTDASNLYLYDAEKPQAERWRFVARLPRSTTATSMAACATTQSSPRQSLTRQQAGISTNLTVTPANCVRTTDDAKFVTFWTPGRLTGDDPDNASADIYAFDADADELSRITAPQGGEGGSYPCIPSNSSVRCNGDPGYASRNRAFLGVATDPAVPGERVAFFQSKSRLVAADVNDEYDVYQWKDGDLSLVSTGASAAGAYYNGNSASGRDVFVMTLDQLSWQDEDAVLDVYDARAGGGIPEPPPLPALCEALAGSCQQPGGGGISSSEATGDSGSGDAASGARLTLTVVSPSAKARRRAARSGVLALRVAASGPGRINAIARGRLGGRQVIVARGAKRLARPGVAVVKLRLSTAARRILRLRRAVRLSVTVSQRDARRRTLTVLLLRAGK